MPDYSYTELPEEKDFRRTLYWDPNVKSNAEGTVTVQFYNSPQCKNLKVCAETVTPQGRMGALK